MWLEVGRADLAGRIGRDRICRAREVFDAEGAADLGDFAEKLS